MAETVPFLESVGERLGCEIGTGETMDGRAMVGLRLTNERGTLWEVSAWGSTEIEAEDNLNKLLHAAGYYRDTI